MPPNKKGGKNYKKGKHDDPDPIMYERLPDQMYGRVIKLLGGCNALVYCNDNRERLCHIRGAMRKKVWIEVGDIVLISLRELDRTGNTSIDSIQRGDICAKYDTRVIYKLKEKDQIGLVPFTYTDPETGEIATKYFEESESSNKIVVRHLGRTADSSEFFTDTVFTPEVIDAIDARVQPLFNYGIEDAGIDEFDIDDETIFEEDAE